MPLPEMLKVQGASLAENPQGWEGKIEMRFRDPSMVCVKCHRAVPRNGDPDPFGPISPRPKNAGPNWVAPVTLLRRAYLSCPWCAKAAMPDAPKKSKRLRKGEKVDGQESLLGVGSIRIS